MVNKMRENLSKYITTVILAQKLSSIFSRCKISQFIILLSFINFLLVLPVRDTTSSHSRSSLPASLLTSHPMRYVRERRGRKRERERKKTKKERDFFPKRQFTVKLLGEAWRILRGVQQVVGCNKLLPATRLALSMPRLVPPLFVWLSPCFCAHREMRVFSDSTCSTRHISRQSRWNSTKMLDLSNCEGALI